MNASPTAQAPDRRSGRRAAVVLLQLLIGVALVAGAGFAVRTWRPRKKPPAGWSIARPPHDVLALASVGDEVWAGGPDGLVVIDASTCQWKREVLAGGPVELVAGLAAYEGHVWVAHRDGLSHFDGAAWERITSPQLPNGQVWAVLRARDGTVWAGTERGAAQLGVRGDRLWTKKDGLASDAVTVLFQDSHDRLWLGNGLTAEGGLTVLEDGSVHTYSVADGLAHSMINAIAEDREGRIWVGAGFGSRGGASRFDGSTWITWQKRDGLAGEKVRSLLVDDDGAIWFGAEYDGAARWNGNRWWYVGSSSGLAGNEVKAMLQDQHGNVWFGTEDGVSRCAREVVR